MLSISIIVPAKILQCSTFKNTIWLCFKSYGTCICYQLITRFSSFFYISLNFLTQNIFPFISFKCALFSHLVLHKESLCSDHDFPEIDHIVSGTCIWSQADKMHPNPEVTPQIF